MDDDAIITVPLWALKIILEDRPRWCKVCLGLSPSWDGHQKNPPCIGYAKEVLQEVMKAVT